MNDKMKDYLDYLTRKMGQLLDILKHTAFEISEEAYAEFQKSVDTFYLYNNYKSSNNDLDIIGRLTLVICDIKILTTAIYSPTGLPYHLSRRDITDSYTDANIQLTEDLASAFDKLILSSQSIAKKFSKMDGYYINLPYNSVADILLGYESMSIEMLSMKTGIQMNSLIVILDFFNENNFLENGDDYKNISLNKLAKTIN